MYEEWRWFCGGNNTADLEGGLSVWINNTCFVNGLTAVPHAAFILIFSFALLLLACITKSSRTEYLLRYPGHSVRWLVGIVSLLVLAASIGEGVLTDQTYMAWQHATQPHYYVSGAAAFLAMFLALIYYHHMELWQLPSMSILLLCYWTLAITGEGIRLAHLKFQSHISFLVLRFDVTLIMLIAYTALAITELNLMRIKVFCKSGLNKIIKADLLNQNMHYMNDCVNLVSKATYWWLNWLFVKGYKKPLEHEDLGDIPEKRKARQHHRRFKEAFEKERVRAQRKGTKPSMLRIYLDVFGAAMFEAAVHRVVADVLNIVGPLCIGGLTTYVVAIAYPEDKELSEPHYVTFDEFFANGFVLVAVMFLALIVRVCFHNMHFHIVFQESANVRAGIQSMVYEKALRLATFTTTGGQMTMGQITNHMSTDVANIMLTFQLVNYLWSAPFQIAIILVQLYFQMGFASLVGASLFIMILPIQFRVAAILANKQKKILGCSDQRLKQTNELLQGIKLLKMYAWEQLYCEAIEAVRKREMGHLLQINLCMITSVFITFGSPLLVTLVVSAVCKFFVTLELIIALQLAFATYPAIAGVALTPQVTFSSLSFFNLIGVPLFIIPMSLSSLVSAIVSSKRIMKFLLAPEVEGGHELSVDGKDNYYSEKKLSKYQPRDEALKDTITAIELQSSVGTQTDDTDDNNLQMNNISLSEDTTSFVASARSESPVAAVKITNGNFVWDPESTSPILSDINVEIPAGKLTMMIGQVGCGKSSLLAAILGEMSTLSGSVHINEQHDRIAYAAQKPWLMNASLRENILFSSVLHKKRYNTVLEACALRQDIDILPWGDKTEIGEKGINLSGGQKQRVSVARAIYANRDIVILDDPLSALDVHVGRQLFEDGIMKQLLNNKKTVILVTHQLQYLSRADLILEMKDGRIAAKGDLSDIIKADPEMYEEIKQVSAVGWDDEQAESAEEERHKLQRRVSKISLDTLQRKGQLVEKEEMVRGAVSYKTYFYLMKNVGWGLVALVVIAVAMQSTFSVTTNFWLSNWSEAGFSNESDRSEEQYIGGYAGLSVATAISQLLSTAVITLSLMVAAKRLHMNMLRNIIHVPLRFFDTTLVGRILNRFSNDTQLIDFRLANSYNAFIISIMQCISSVVVVAIVMPIFLVFVVPIALIYYFLQNYYLAASRELQRLDSTSKSPVIAYFSESLGGLSTIRAYRCENVFYKTILSRIDKNTGAFIYLQTANRWLGVRLDFLGSIFVLLASTSTLIGALVYGIDPSLVGLSTTYAIQLSSYLNYLMRNRSEVEMQMNAVERIQYYTDVDRENYGGTKPASSWPQRGEIRIENVSVRYAQDLDAVLTNVSLCLKAGEKVGICGRTGSGKSSLTLALLRVIDIFEGRIFIDDVDIESVPLTVLRSQISIIPQDPVLFTGPIRNNLDPEKKVADDELWHALEISQLKDVVSQLDAGLDSKVTEGGENFSVGQRQLFCLARAFIRKSHILIMDEATASIDLETDRTLQSVVTTAFAKRTVLTIAHRIETIRNSDKIVVLDGGRVAEFGSPDELLADEDGMFTALVKGE